MKDFKILQDANELRGRKGTIIQFYHGENGPTYGALHSDEPVPHWSKWDEKCWGLTCEVSPNGVHGNCPIEVGDRYRIPPIEEQAQVRLSYSETNQASVLLAQVRNIRAAPNLPLPSLEETDEIEDADLDEQSL